MTAGRAAAARAIRSSHCVAFWWSSPVTPAAEVSPLSSCALSTTTTPRPTTAASASGATTRARPRPGAKKAAKTTAPTAAAVGPRFENGRPTAVDHEDGQVSACCVGGPALLLTPAALERYGRPAAPSDNERRAGRLQDSLKTTTPPELRPPAGALCRLPASRRCR